MKVLFLIISYIMCLLIVFLNINNLTSSLPIVIKIKENTIIEEIKKDLTFLNAPKEKLDNLANAIFIANQSTDINYKLIISLMYTESNFDYTAIGPKNRTKIRYKGLMQTPTATWFSDVDTLHGARILKNKLKIANNDIKLALALYKGGNNNTAKKQAKKVLELYKTLQMQNEET
ncbi:MAG: lytic transglycosylase domain-containing protein [Candidatus Caldatribacteriota bacterium]